MSKNFSLDQTIELFDNFDSITSGPLADVASALRDLAALPETLGAASAPQIPADVVHLSHRINRNVTVAIAATGIAIASTLTAAALTGVGPAPVVKFAKKTFTAIAHVFTAPAQTSNVVETQPVAEEPINEEVPITSTPAQPSALPDPAPRPTPVQSSQLVAPAAPAAPASTPTQAAKPVAPVAMPTISGKNEVENETKKTESESSKTESNKVESNKTESSKTESSKTETTKSESVKSSPTPVKSETKKSETKAESSKSSTPKAKSTEKSDD